MAVEWCKRDLLGGWGRTIFVGIKVKDLGINMRLPQCAKGKVKIMKAQEVSARQWAARGGDGKNPEECPTCSLHPYSLFPSPWLEIPLPHPLWHVSLSWPKNLSCHRCLSFVTVVTPCCHSKLGFFYPGVFCRSHSISVRAAKGVITDLSPALFLRIQ